MQAIVHDRYGSTDGLELREVPTPSAGAGEVLVRVRAAGVDRSVWHLMTGQPYPMRLAGYGVRRPKNPTLGVDLAGVVEAVGAGVTTLRPGDEVLGTGRGTYATFAVSTEKGLVQKPVNVSFEQAAVVGVSGLAALHAIRDSGDVRRGQRVLVIGASGGVGGFAVQLAKAYGAEVTGLCRPTKRDLVLALGADHVIDRGSDRVDGGRVGRVGRGSELLPAGADPYDVVIDTGGNRPLRDLRRVLVRGGTLVVVGGENGGRWLGGTDRQLRAVALSPFVRHRLRVLVSTGNRADLTVLAEHLAAGTLTPVVERTFTLAETAKAIRHLEDGHVRGKVAITL